MLDIRMFVNLFQNWIVNWENLNKYVLAEEAI